MTHPRGDVQITINGARHKLRLTLGALADIETALGGGDFEALKTRLKQPRISDVILILHALLMGGGSALAIEALKASDVDLVEAANAIAKAFETLNMEAPGKPDRVEEGASSGAPAAAPKNGAPGSATP